MPFLNNITKNIDALLNTKVLCNIPVSKIKNCGIAETVVDWKDLDGNGEQVKFPAFVNNNAEAVMIIPNDNFHLITYHKINSIQTTLVAKKAFGDDLGDLKETVSMNLMVLYFIDKIQQPAYQIDALFRDAMPKFLMIKNKSNTAILQQSYMQPTVSNFDKINLLNREWTGIELSYINIQFFELQYKIESTWKRGCYVDGNCNCN